MGVLFSEGTHDEHVMMLRCRTKESLQSDVALLTGRPIE